MEELIEKIQELSNIMEKFLNKIDNNGFYNAKEAAEYLGMSIHTLYGKHHKGEIESYKSGKPLVFTKDNLDKYLERGKDE